MNPSDFALLALAIAVAGGLIGAGIVCAAGIVAEPLSRIAAALTPDDAFPQFGAPEEKKGDESFD